MPFLNWFEIFQEVTIYSHTFSFNDDYRTTIGY